MDHAQKILNKNQSNEDETSNFCQNVYSSLSRYTVFYKSSLLHENINNSNKITRSIEDKRHYEKKATNKFPRRVSSSSPSQTLHEAYARVLKHKPKKYNDFQINNSYSVNEFLEEKNRSVHTNLDVQTSLYPTTKLNPELEKKIKLIDQLNRNDRKLNHRLRQYSSPRNNTKIRKRSPIKISPIKYHNVSVLLLQEEGKVRCDSCGKIKCDCYLRTLDRTTTR